MVYISGADDLADIIETIADAMIAGYATWEDGDATWVTTDKTADNARRCLKYTGDATDIWIALEAINTSHQTSFISNYADTGKGLRVTVSASWDGGGHTYPVDNQQTFLSFETRHTVANPATVNADLATLLVSYFAWYEENGFVIIGKPDPNATDNRQNSFFLAVERVTAKEYVDGYTSFYVAAAMNYYAVCDNTYDTWQFRPYLRPFNFEYSVDHSTNSNFYNHGVSHPEYLRAIKSNGNGKAYFARPIYQNEDGVRSPIAEPDMWFGYSPAYGLVDGDIIAIDGETTKYLLKALSSPDSVTTLPFAIKYVA